MAIRFRIANYGQTKTVNLYDGTLQLRDMSWATRAPSTSSDYVSGAFGSQVDFSHYEPITETFGLVSSDSEATIIGAVRDLQKTFEGARRYHYDPHVDDSYWLEANCDSESARRSLIYEGSLQVQAGVGYEPFLDCGGVMIQATITRHPFWETTTYLASNLNDLSCLGGMGQWANVQGDVPARIYATAVKGSSGGGGPMTRIWMGIREEYDGMLNFEPVWELEDGTNATDASDAVDATASGGDKVTVNFATQTGLAERCAITVYDVCTANGHSSYTHFYGTYLVLLRAKVTAGTIGIQLRKSYSESSYESASEEIFITDTSWRLFELGEVTIKEMPGRLGNASTVAYDELRIYAEQISGAGSLDLDCLVLIPNRHFVYADGSYIVLTGGDDRPLYVVCDENDEVTAFALWGSYPRLNVVYTHRDWYLPAGNGFLVLAGERASSHVLTDVVDLSWTHFPRWMTYRETDGT